MAKTPGQMMYEAYRSYLRRAHRIDMCTWNEMPADAQDGWGFIAAPSRHHHEHAKRASNKRRGGGR